MRNRLFTLMIGLLAGAAICMVACKNPIDDPEPSDNAKLSALSVSAGSLEPAFNPAVTEYSVSVGNDVESIIVTGKAANKGARIGDINGKPRSLSVGANAIPIVVTAADRKTTKTYVVAVTRAVPPTKPSDPTTPAAPTDPTSPTGATATLSALTVSAGTLRPAFSPSVTEYSVDVAADTASITVTGVASGTGASVGGASGVATVLNAGANSVAIVVTAADKTTTKTYTVSVYRVKAADDSSNADLSGLSISPGALRPEFSPSITEYTATVGRSTPSATVTGTGANAAATLGGDNGVSKALAFGDNALKIPVTAPDGITVKTYTVTVTRTNDTTGPKLTGFTISTTSIDSSTGDQTVSGTISAEDENGVGYIYMNYSGPDGSRSLTLTRREGECSDTKASYDWKLTVNKGSRGGTWTLTLYLSDTFENRTWPDMSGYTTSFVNTAPEGDKTGPKLTGFTISTTSIDSSKGDQTVSGTLSAEDESGVGYIYMNFSGPDGSRYPTLTEREGECSDTKVSYDWKMTVTKGARGGTWKLNLYLNDAFENRTWPDMSGYATSFIDTAPEGDKTGPKLTGFTISTTSIDSSKGDQTVSGTLSAEDESGVDYVYFVYSGPDGSRYPTLTRRESECSDTKVSYDWVLTIKQGMRGGTWKQTLYLNDSFENRTWPDMSGYATSFVDSAPSE